MDNTSIRISAIIPVYNGRKYIREAVNSVLNQKLKPIELIVVDDGSSDGSMDELSDLTSSIPIRFLSQKNAGQSSARNNGASKAIGDYLAFLDQDDVWYSDHLSKLSEPFLENDKLGWTYSDFDEADESGQIVTKQLLKHSGLGTEHPKARLIALLSADIFILPSATLISKQAFDSVFGFDERLSGYEDDDLFQRIFRKGYDNVFLEYPLSKWRIYGNSTSYTPRMSKSRRIYAQKLMDTYPNDPEMGRFWVRDCIAPRFFYTSLSLYMRALEAGDWTSCRANYVDMCIYIQYFRLGKKMRMKLKLLKHPLMYSRARQLKAYIPSIVMRILR